MELKVYRTCCQNCLLSKDRIVPPKMAKSIIKECIKEQNYFICHKASINDEQIVCRKFYNIFGHFSQMIRIAQRLGLIKIVEQEDSEKLPTYSEMYSK